MLIIAPKPKATVNQVYTLKGDKPVEVTKSISGRDATYSVYPTEEGIEIPVNSVTNAHNFVGKEATQIRCISTTQYFEGRLMQGTKTTYEIVK